ncbi:hypothetical protein BGY98DRAFT_1023141, partial [Russula aff. rugulosa BPL654]
MVDSPSVSSADPGHIPKRGARACTACRKGKNSCEGEVMTRLYRLGPKIYKTGSLSSLSVNRAASLAYSRKPQKKNGQLLSTASVECTHVSLSSSLPFLTHFSSCRIDVYHASARVLMPYSFFSGCQLLHSHFDVSYDGGLKERSPWTFDAVSLSLAISEVAITPAPSFYMVLEEAWAQGIARFSLFSPVVLKKPVR